MTPAVVAVVAEDDVLRREEVARLRAEATGGGGGDFNVDELEASDEAVARALAAAATLPVMAPRRWVHLSELQRLGAGGHGPLLAYLAAPHQSTVLCLSASKLDLRTALGRALRDHGVLRQLAAPRPWELAGWLVARARRGGAACSDAAAAALVEAAGPDLGPLCQALDTALTYAHPEAPLTEAHVNAALPCRAPARVFALVEALGAGAWPALTMTMRRLLADGQSAPGLVAMLVRQLHLLLAVHGQPAAARSPAALAASISVPPFVAQRLASQARRLSAAQAQAALALALAADAELKRSPLEPAARLDQLLWDMAAAAASPPALLL